MKRIFDLFNSILLLVFLSPLILTVILILVGFQGYPVIFKQQRAGLHGTSFFIYKFRTMNESSDSDGNLLPDEERLTGLGKVLRRLSLDELPQLFNVIKGDLSLVGPRPLPFKYLDLYTQDQLKRHAMKPGITGWAQINGRNKITWEEKFKLDIWYIDHYSFWLDIKILFLTIGYVLMSKGISANGDATMPEFTGEKRNKDNS